MSIMAFCASSHSVAGDVERFDTIRSMPDVFRSTVVAPDSSARPHFKLKALAGSQTLSPQPEKDPHAQGSDSFRNSALDDTKISAKGPA